MKVRGENPVFPATAFGDESVSLAQFLARENKCLRLTTHN